MVQVPYTEQWQILPILAELKYILNKMYDLSPTGSHLILLSLSTILHRTKHRGAQHFYILLEEMFYNKHLIRGFLPPSLLFSSNLCASLIHNS